jgi:hypothetical protein
MLGTLDNTSGQPIEIKGLWGLNFGNGGLGGSVDDLYFTAGIPDGGMVEDHGLFGQISVATPDGTSTGFLLGTAFLGILACRRGHILRTTTQARAPVH